jgi:hypothetical protein
LRLRLLLGILVKLEIGERIFLHCKIFAVCKEQSKRLPRGVFDISSETSCKPLGIMGAKILGVT